MNRATGETMEQELFELDEETLMGRENVAEQHKEETKAYSRMLHQYLKDAKR